MARVRLLDCTLRDGGYCNGWRFGEGAARRVVSALDAARVDVVELGYLSSGAEWEVGRTLFPRLADAGRLLPEAPVGAELVAMANYGELDASTLPPVGETPVTGLRVAFHREDADAALDLCSEVMALGYDAYLQPMVSLRYSDAEFLGLVESANALRPKALYIVDSFGTMRGEDVERLAALLEHDLDPGVEVGFHAHNNLQLAYSNARLLVEAVRSHGLIVDTSVFGMGRGAGNLATELFCEHLNRRLGASYDVAPLLPVMDEVIAPFHESQPWGYSVANYLSAVHGAHPSYAAYLDDRKTLTVGAMDEVFGMMDPARRHHFDASYAAELYDRYMGAHEADESRMGELAAEVAGREVVLVAPGPSSAGAGGLVRERREAGELVVSVNHVYPGCEPDLVFASNMRRASEVAGCGARLVVTSNVPAEGAWLQVSRDGLLNAVEPVRDNAGLMAMRLLHSLGASSIGLVGFDGYSHDASANYADGRMALAARRAALDAMNDGMREVLAEWAPEMGISFLTAPVHVTIGAAR